MATEFGKQLRKIRIDYDETIRQMASRLNVSPSFLSSIETGKRSIPKGFAAKVADVYSLSEDEKSALQRALDASLTTIKISLVGFDAPQRELVVTVANELPTLSGEVAKQILDIINSVDRKRELSHA